MERDFWRFARVAQLAEHTLGKGEVIGSIPLASLQEQGLCGGTVLRDWEGGPVGPQSGITVPTFQSRVSVPLVGPFITQESR